MHRGFFALWRKYIDSEVFLHEGLWKLWTLCMSKANWEANSVKLEGVTQPVKLQPGQFITGRYELHGEYHQWRRGSKKRSPSSRTAWRWLKTLEKMGFLTIKSTNKFSIITMANWPIEQTEKQKVSSNLTNRRPTDDHRESLNKHYKKGKRTPTPEKTAFKEKADIRPCKQCGKGFVPTKHWHTVCDECYRPDSEKRYSWPKCKICGAENNTVIQGLCNYCQWEQEEAALGE